MLRSGVTLAGVAAVLTMPLNIVRAQEGQKQEFVIGTIALTPAVDSPEYQQEATAISGIITEVLNNNPSFKVIPRNMSEIISDERKEQMSAEHIMGRIAEQGKADGAQQMLSGTLDRLQTNAEESKGGSSLLTGGKLNPLSSVSKGATVATATVSFTLMLVDVATGSSIDTKTFTVTGTAPGFGGGGANAAITSANKLARRQITNWVVTFLNYDFKIMKVEEADKKGIPKTVLIKGGTNMALEPGEDLQVKHIEMLEGQPRERLISELTVKTVEGAFSVCTVTKDADLLKVMMDAKAELKIMFPPEKK